MPSETVRTVTVVTSEITITDQRGGGGWAELARPSEVELRAGARIVALEQRRRRTREGARASSWFGLAATVLLIITTGVVVITTAHEKATVAMGSFLLAELGLLYALAKGAEDDAGVDCTPDELASLIGYVTARPGAAWKLTDRGTRARTAYLEHDTPAKDAA